MPAITRTAVLLTATAALAIPAATAHAAPTAAAGETITQPLQTALKALTIKDEDRTGYQRESFKHWVDADHDGCNTRSEVLKAEALTTPEQGPKCKLSGGSWYSPYDNQYVEGPSGLDIDHVVSAAPTLQREELKGQNVSGIPATSLRASLGAAADPGQQLEDLTVAPKGSMDGYSRDKYPHWADQGANCNTREVVLKRDGKNVTTDSQCRAVSGTWVSPYDGATWSDPADVDIDHMVPLANSWVSGASKWTTAQRKAFANDLTNPQLLAVTDNVNQAKGDKSPDAWRPPLQSNWCHYSTDWIAVKYRYKLTITAQEKTTLKDMLTRC